MNYSSSSFWLFHQLHHETIPEFNAVMKIFLLGFSHWRFATSSSTNLCHSTQWAASFVIISEENQVCFWSENSMDNHKWFEFLLLWELLLEIIQELTDISVVFLTSHRSGNSAWTLGRNQLKGLGSSQLSYFHLIIASRYSSRQSIRICNWVGCLKQTGFTKFGCEKVNGLRWNLL